MVETPPALAPELPPPGAEPLPEAKREAFCHEYLKDLKQGPAATRAGYTDNPESAAVQGSRLLSDVNVRARIDFLTSHKNRLVGLNAEDILRAINELANSDASLLYDDDGVFMPLKDMPPEVRRCIASVKTSETYEVEVRKEKTLIKGKKKGAKVRSVMRKKKYHVMTVVMEVKLWDKPKGLTKLGEHLVLFARRQLVSAPNGGPVQHAVGVVTYTKEQADAAYRNLGLGEFAIPGVVAAVIPGAVAPQPVEPKP